MAVEEIFTIASRSFRILGSGTSSTCTVLRPDQTVARISGPRLLELFVVQRLRGALLQLALGELALGARVGARDLAGLDQVLEAPQVVLRLGERLGPGELPGHLAELAGNLDLDVDLGAAVAGRVLEADGRVAGLAEACLLLGPAALDLIAREIHGDRRSPRTHVADLRWLRGLPNGRVPGGVAPKLAVRARSATRRPSAAAPARPGARVPRRAALPPSTGRGARARAPAAAAAWWR